MYIHIRACASRQFFYRHCVDETRGVVEQNTKWEFYSAARKVCRALYILLLLLLLAPFFYTDAARVYYVLCALSSSNTDSIYLSAACVYQVIFNSFSLKGWNKEMLLRTIKDYVYKANIARTIALYIMFARLGTRLIRDDDDTLRSLRPLRRRRRFYLTVSF